MRIVISRSEPGLFAAQLVVSPDDPTAVAQIAALGPLDRNTTEVRHKGAPGDYSLAIQTQIERQFSRLPSSGNGAGPCVEAEAMQARTEPPMSEAAFQTLVIDLAHQHGWLVGHFAAARTQDGWRTPARADAAGFPDLTLCREGVVLFAELKSDAGKVSPQQRVWLDALGDLGRVWRPSMLPEIEEALR